MNELLLPSSTHFALDATGLVAAFFSGQKPLTQKAYRQDLQSFASFLGFEKKKGALPNASIEPAAWLLISQDSGKANALVHSFQTHLKEQELSPATINRRMAAITSLVRLARKVGLCSYSLDIDHMGTEKLRDTRGPGKDGALAMMALLVNRTDRKGRRDLAILHLLYDVAMRRGEVCSLDIEHIDLSGRCAWVMGKGRNQRQRLTLPLSTCEVLGEWLKVREATSGPLFVALNPAAYGERLSGEGLYYVIDRLGKEIGKRVRPHGLRHAAITEALDVTNGDIRKVRQFSRHKSMDMLLIYDDARKDFGGEVADLIASK
jgi:integrase/recombinase XerC